MRAGVVLPPGYAKGDKKNYATVYHVHGFGGDHLGAWRQGVQLVKEMTEGKHATGINATPGSTGNAYREADGSPKQLVQRNGQWIATIEQFARQSAVTGEYGGQFASFEWVWSPRGQDGRPMQSFNRETGKLDPVMLEAWRKYDIRLILEKNWGRSDPNSKRRSTSFAATPIPSGWKRR